MQNSNFYKITQADLPTLMNMVHTRDPDILELYEMTGVGGEPNELVFPIMQSEVMLEDMLDNPEAIWAAYGLVYIDLITWHHTIIEEIGQEYKYEMLDKTTGFSESYAYNALFDSESVAENKLLFVLRAWLLAYERRNTSVQS